MLKVILNYLNCKKKENNLWVIAKAMYILYITSYKSLFYGNICYIIYINI